MKDLKDQDREIMMNIFEEIGKKINQKLATLNGELNKREKQMNLIQFQYFFLSKIPVSFNNTA